MGILSGIFSYLFGLIINLLDVSISTFLGAIGFDLDTFETYFPAAADYYEVIIGFAIGLLLIMLIFQLFRNFGVVLDMEVEDPLKMLGKTVLFFGMILNARSITTLITDLLVDPYAIFLNTYSADSISFSLIDLLGSMIGGLGTSTFTSVVYIIMLIILGWNFLKFVVEIVERYIVFYFILYCAPVVFSTGAFKSTAQIFKSWCRMLGSQAMLLLLNVWSIKLFISFMEGFKANGGDLIFYFLLGYGFLKFSQKADTLLRILGLNTASTGDVVRSLGSTLGGIAQAVRTAGGMASRMFGGRGGKGGAGGSTSGESTGNGGSGGSGGEAGRMGTPGGGNNPSGSQAGGMNGSPVGGVTASATDKARTNYVNDVLNTAREQMGANGAAVSNQEQPLGEPGEVNPAGVGAEDQNDSIQMDGNDGNAGSGDGFGNRPHINNETMEGLNNIARGLPHDHYDAEKRRFSGGGFQEFTGADANMIGASQMPPAEGFTQSNIKMPDGTNATMYKNDETGDSHIVQFGSVDNGVIQGVISDVDPESGRLGDQMAFKAVHESVPGATDFSQHASPVSDGSGGSYYVATGYVATGGERGIFAPGQASSMPSAAGGGESVPGSVASTPETTTVYQATASSASTDFVAGGSVGMPGNGGGSPPQNSPADNDAIGDTAPSIGSETLSHSVSGPSELGTDTSHHSHSVSHETVQSGIGVTTAQPGSPPHSGAGQSDTASTLSGTSGEATGVQQEAPPIHAGMQPPKEIRRFSKHNPDNQEVFRRSSQTETFSHAENGGSDNISMNSTDKKG